MLVASERGAFAQIELPGDFNGSRVGISERGAAELAGWLAEFAGVRLPQVWGAAEIIAHYEISSRTLANWRRHPSFPRPRELAAGPVWEAVAVRRWERKDRPRRGRPRRAARHA